MIKIGDFSKLAQVTVKTLRYYDGLGLLKPAWIDRFNGYRYYTADQLPRLNRILALKDLGFSLDQIRRLISKDLPAAELRGMMRIKQAELEREIQVERERLLRIEARLEQIESEGSLPAYEIVIKAIPVQHVIGIRGVLPSIAHLPGQFERLREFIVRSRLPIADSLPWIALYYDGEYRESGLDVEVAVPYSGSMRHASPFSIHELPGVEAMACTVHQGTYEDLELAYKAVVRWSQLSGYSLETPNRDLYLIAPASSQSPDDYITEVQFPVSKKSLPMIINQNQEKIEMQPKIISKPAFTAVGIEYFGKNENNEIAAMWQRFTPRIGEIKHILDGAFGLCMPAEETGEFAYLASMAVSDTSTIPDGMEVWEVPAQTYAVFPSTLPTIHDTYKYAMETWLPESGYVYSQGPDYEYYDENFNPNEPNSIFQIYVPIKPVK